MITSHVTNIYGIIDTFTIPMTTKFTRMVKKTCTNLVVHVVVTSEPLGHATNRFHLIFLCLITTKLDRIVDQQALALTNR